jgi:hypothetical protein
LIDGEAGQINSLECDHVHDSCGVPGVGISGRIVRRKFGRSGGSCRGSANFGNHHADHGHVQLYRNQHRSTAELFSVIMWHLQNRIWLPILFIVLECGIVAGGYGLEKLENNLAGPKILPSGKKKRKRSAG